MYSQALSPKIAVEAARDAFEIDVWGSDPDSSNAFTSDVPSAPIYTDGASDPADKDKGATEGEGGAAEKTESGRPKRSVRKSVRISEG